MKDTDPFLNFINKVLFPLVQLSSEKDVDAFFNVNKEWEENTPFFKNTPAVLLGDEYLKSNVKTRVVVFMYDKEDFADELNTIRKAGRGSAGRIDLRLGIVTDGKVIKRFKARYGSLYFPDGAHTSMVLMRNDG